MPAGPPGCWALPVERNTPLQARAGPGDDQRGVGARAPQADEGPEAHRGESTMATEKIRVTWWGGPGRADPPTRSWPSTPEVVNSKRRAKPISLPPVNQEARLARSRPVPFGGSSGTVACDPLVEPPGASTSQSSWVQNPEVGNPPAVF